MSEARWYTSARRFPQLIGRTPDGSKLPGGPYTILQLVAAAVTVFVLWHTAWAWARFGFISNLLVAAGLLFGSVWLAGRLPYGMRNPLVIVGGWLSASERAMGGARPPVRLRRPRLARGGQVVMITDWAADSATSAAAGPDPLVDEAGDPVVDLLVGDGVAVVPSSTCVTDVRPGLPALSGVQRLLAQSIPQH